MSILSELKKLTGKQNAKVVSEALPDEMGGGGSLYVFGSDFGTIPNDIDINEAWFNDTEFVLRINDGERNGFWLLPSVCKFAAEGKVPTPYRFLFINPRSSNSTISVYEVVINVNTRAYTVSGYDYTLTTA